MRLITTKDDVSDITAVDYGGVGRLPFELKTGLHNRTGKVLYVTTTSGTAYTVQPERGRRLNGTVEVLVSLPFNNEGVSIDPRFEPDEKFTTGLTVEDFSSTYKKFEIPAEDLAVGTVFIREIGMVMTTKRYKEPLRYPNYPGLDDKLKLLPLGLQRYHYAVLRQLDEEAPPITCRIGGQDVTIPTFYEDWGDDYVVDITLDAYGDVLTFDAIPLSEYDPTIFDENKDAMDNFEEEAFAARLGLLNECKSEITSAIGVYFDTSSNIRKDSDNETKLSDNARKAVNENVKTVIDVAKNIPKI